MAIDIKEFMTPPVLLIIFLLVISLMFIFPVLNMIILGALLAYLVRPVADKIQSKLKYSSISIILAMIVVLIPLILLVAYISLEISNFITSMLASNYYADIGSLISQLPFDTTSINSGSVIFFSFN